MNKFGFPILISLFFFSNSYAQTSKVPAANRVVKSLEIGDLVPDIAINNIINYSRSSVKISDYKGKLLILDFWATWCGPCIAAFPKLDSLQKEFQNELMILPVTTEARNKVQDFLRKMNNIKKLLPATATDDSMLNAMFKHKFLPHYVWIDGNHKVIAITESKDLTRSNISRAIKGESLMFKPKNDNYKVARFPGANVTFLHGAFFHTQNDMEFRQLPDSNFVMYTSLSKYTEGAVTGGNFSPNTISIRNSTILTLYRWSLLESGVGAINLSRIVVDIPDSSLYEKIVGIEATGMEATEWLRNYGFSYEIKVPVGMKKAMYKIMVDDLNRYFGAVYNIEGVIEERETKYLALVRNKPEDNLASKGGKPVVKKDKFSLVMKNVPLTTLLAELTIPLQSRPPLFDETGYEGRVDIELNCSLSDLAGLQRELAKYGLRLEEKVKLMKIGVIKQKHN